MFGNKQQAKMASSVDMFTTVYRRTLMPQEGTSDFHLDKHCTTLLTASLLKRRATCRKAAHVAAIGHAIARKA